MATVQPKELEPSPKSLKPSTNVRNSSEIPNRGVIRFDDGGDDTGHRALFPVSRHVRPGIMLTMLRAIAIETWAYRVIQHDMPSAVGFGLATSRECTSIKGAEQRVPGSI